MREIIFRGKDRMSGEWVYGDLYQERHSDGTIKTTIVQPLSVYNVDPDTVGQYTGLTDKNGNKIFEGDIIKVVSLHYETLGKKINGEIVYDRGCFWVERIDARGLKQSLSAAELENNIEVIGNIHDNSELIK